MTNERETEDQRRSTEGENFPSSVVRPPSVLTETQFYNRLAESFDVMTDWQSRLAFEMPFLESMLNRFNAKSVLDCACGTGWHAIEFARRGYRVGASDISATMIARAKENTHRENVNVEFQIAGFQSLRETFKEKFDAVFCLGNSFVHVLAEDAALESVKNMRDCLREGGVLVMHNLNYDKRWKEKPRWFAVNAGMLNESETLIWRFADYAEGQETRGEGQVTHHPPRITFNIALFTKSDSGTWSVQVQSTPQRPYQKSQLENLLIKAGFRNLEFYGDLQGKPFDVEKSGDLVIVASA
jgi:SAM-dependent methyltransferase